jgi:prepilin-type N-terminal cleavage/methylation domain-containing protein
MRFTSRNHRPGFSLIEIVISLFVLALGLIMTAAAIPASCRAIGDANDLTTSGMVGRWGIARLQQTAGNLAVPVSGSGVQWYGPAVDLTVPPYGGPPTYWLVNDPAGFGTAAPYPADRRYAYQVFYQRRGTSAPYDWDFYIAVQIMRDGRFPAPVGSAGQSQLLTGDIFCTPAGTWQRYEPPPAGYPADRFAFGVPGGVMVYQTAMRF